MTIDDKALAKTSPNQESASLDIIYSVSKVKMKTRESFHNTELHIFHVSDLTQADNQVFIKGWIHKVAQAKIYPNEHGMINSSFYIYSC